MLNSLGSHRHNQTTLAAKRRAAACRLTRHMPGLLERPLATQRRAPIESVRRSTRFPELVGSAVARRMVATMARPSRQVMCSLRFHATELTTLYFACKGVVPSPGTKGTSEPD